MGYRNRSARPSDTQKPGFVTPPWTFFFFFFDEAEGVASDDVAPLGDAVDLPVAEGELVPLGWLDAVDPIEGKSSACTTFPGVALPAIEVFGVGSFGLAANVVSNRAFPSVNRAM